MQYYLNRVRKLLEYWNSKGTSKKVERYLSTTVLEDLKLWLKVFLPRVKSGLSLNLITFRRPSYVCWSDACPQGLGGYNFRGNAWRYPIPEKFQTAVLNRNNALELFAAIITIWIAILNGEVPPEMCSLSFCDNSSAVGWLYKANIDESKNLPLHSAARKYAEVLLNSSCCLYSQHIMGVHNNVADALSRKNDVQDEILTKFIVSTYPSQVLTSFQIKPIPQEISSWLTSWLLKCNEIMASHKIQETKSQGHGRDGRSTQKLLNTIRTFGLPTSPCKNEQPSWELSPQPSEDDNFPERMRKTWQLQQYRRPWQSWVRSLGQTWGTTPHLAMEQMDSTHPLPDNLRE
jgi:hypothetical protein